jgi:hypothetical protein
MIEVAMVCGVKFQTASSDPPIFRVQHRFYLLKNQRGPNTFPAHVAGNTTGDQNLHIEATGQIEIECKEGLSRFGQTERSGCRCATFLRSLLETCFPVGYCRYEMGGR